MQEKQHLVAERPKPWLRSRPWTSTPRCSDGPPEGDLALTPSAASHGPRAPLQPPLHQLQPHTEEGPCPPDLEPRELSSIRHQLGVPRVSSAPAPAELPLIPAQPTDVPTSGTFAPAGPADL